MGTADRPVPVAKWAWKPGLRKRDLAGESVVGREIRSEHRTRCCNSWAICPSPTWGLTETPAVAYTANDVYPSLADQASDQPWGLHEGYRFVRREGDPP